MKITDDEGRNWAVQRVLEGMSVGQVAATLGSTKTELQEMLYQYRDQVLGSMSPDDFDEWVDRELIVRCAAMTRRGERIKSKLRTIFVDTPRLVFIEVPRSIFTGLLPVFATTLAIIVPLFFIWAILDTIILFQPFENQLDRTVLNCKGKMASDHQTRIVEVDAIMNEYAWHSLKLINGDNKWIEIWVQTEDPIYMYSYFGEEDKHWKRSI